MNIVKKFDEVVASETSAKLLKNVNDIKWLYKECEEALNNNKIIITFDGLPTLEILALISYYGFKIKPSYKTQINVFLNRNSLMHLSNDYMKVKNYRGE